MGNGVTDNEFDGNALVPFAHGMGLISDDLYEVREKHNTRFTLSDSLCNVPGPG